MTRELSALAKKRRRIVHGVEDAIYALALIGGGIAVTAIVELLCKIAGCGA